MGVGSSHAPAYGDAFVDALVDWLLSQRLVAPCKPPTQPGERQAHNLASGVHCGYATENPHYGSFLFGHNYARRSAC